MHVEADEYVSRYATGAPLDILDIGGRNINGSPRRHFPAAQYTVLDIEDGWGVDICADATTWQPDRQYDRVVCTEVFEHTQQWPAILETAFAALRSGGDIILTMAGPGREPHSGYDGGSLRNGEWYDNVYPWDLARALEKVGFRDADVEYLAASFDTRARAVKP